MIRTRSSIATLAFCIISCREVTLILLILKGQPTDVFLTVHYDCASYS